MIATSKDTKDRGSWLTIKEAAGVFGITQQGFRASHLPGLKPEHVRVGAKRLAMRVYGPAVVAAYLDRELVKRMTEDDGLSDGGNSPGLERWRLAKAELTEIQLEKERKRVFPRDMAREVLGRVASLWRRYGERLAKRRGPEEAASFNDTFEAARKIVDHEFGGNDISPDSA